MSDDPKRILYCRCAYAQTVPDDVKNEVLEGLANSNKAFDCVSDLCEMSARRDDRLKEIAKGGPTTIIACYPRAVKWLFSAGEAKWPEDAEIEVLNMRTQSAKEILDDVGIEKSQA